MLNNCIVFVCSFILFVYLFIFAFLRKNDMNLCNLVFPNLLTIRKLIRNALFVLVRNSEKYQRKMNECREKLQEKDAGVC